MLIAAGFAVVAQTPAPAGQPPAGQPGQAPPAPGAPAQDDPAGRGRGRRGGGQDLTGIDFTKQPPVLAKTPEEQLKLFILPPGYRLELVLADPIIQEPTAIAFDGNGRMFVVEDRSYMLDLDMTGQLDPISRISLHVDTNNDGVYDKHTVFVDNLVFPRFVTPFGPNTILTKESNAQEVWKYTDTNRDGVADKKELFDTGYGRLANIEGQEAFLTWTLDNWMYSTYNAFRARWTPHGIVKEPTGSNRGEWGVTQDDDGKMWFESGAPGVPVSFQFPIVYGNFTVPDELETDFRIPWGAPVRVADMQGGLNATRMPDGSLKSVTGSAGNDIYRGHRLPKDLVGEYIYGEPVGRIVRRIHAEKKDGLTFLRNAYPNNEFIKSLDPLFRPVDVTTAPDGTIYITDMYHGIIQVGNFAGPGTYLRARVLQYDLDKIIHKGRIWRLVYDGVKPDRSDALRRDRIVPRMHNETPAQLVRHFHHPNGWWRDTAQQLLVLKQDKSVVPALQLMARSSKNLLARFHAMWTLEGLGALKPALVRQLMEDSEPRMRIQAIRASETLFKAGDRSFAADYTRLTKDSSVDVVIQALLTINRWKAPDAAAITTATMAGQSGAWRPARGHDDAQTAGGARRRRARRAADARATEASRARRRDLQRDVLRVSRPRRIGHAETRARDDDGAAAGRIAPRERPSRLHRQDRAARPRRPRGRQDLHGHDDPDEQLRRRVDRVRGLVRPPQLRQHRRIRHAGGRGTRAGRERQPQNAVDAAGADRVTAGGALHGRLEADGQPQSGGHTRRHHADDVEFRRTTTRHVVPGRAAKSGVGHRNPVSVTGAGRSSWAWLLGGTRLGRSAVERAARVPAWIQGGSLDGWHVMEAGRRGRRQRPHDDRHLPARPGEVRPHEPDGDRRGRAGVVYPEPADLCAPSGCWRRRRPPVKKPQTLSRGFRL